LRGDVKNCHALDLQQPKTNEVILDVRSIEEFKAGGIPRVVNIPVDQLTGKGKSMLQSCVNGLFGGILIGFAAIVLFRFNGRIMGVSGIVSRLLAKPSQDSSWRVAFITGLVAAAWTYGQKNHVQISIDASWLVLVIAGFLVGFGTVTANGCTSGHGICGLARLSKRSFVATLVFMLMGMVTVWGRRAIGQ
jgi:uncharacterized membrane protein YedE/YeeE